MRRELSVREAADGEGRLYPMRLSVWALRALTRLRVTAKYEFPGPSSRRKVGLGLGRAWRRAVPAEVGPRLWVRDPGLRVAVQGRRRILTNLGCAVLRLSGPSSSGNPRREIRGGGDSSLMSIGDFVGHSKPADVGWNFHYYCERDSQWRKVVRIFAGSIRPSQHQLGQVQTLLPVRVSSCDTYWVLLYSVQVTYPVGSGDSVP